MAKPTFAVVWGRIVEQVGQSFTTKSGLPFVYSIHNDKLETTRTNYRISRKDFETAFGLVPLEGPGKINQLVRGPGYVWAILHDERISQHQW